MNTETNPKTVATRSRQLPRVALVTGGATGIGAAIVAQLAAQGSGHYRRHQFAGRG